MKCPRTRSEFLKKCFLPFELLLMALLLSACSSEPVYIAEEIDVNELWNGSESTVMAERVDETAQEWDGVTVYYTESGTVWHKSADCPALSESKNVITGTQDEAESAGKDRACKRCG